MQTMFFDAESYYSTEYSLRRMDPPSYILDPRFELIMAAVAFDDGPITVVDGPDLGGYLGSLDPAQITMVSHNAQFDASILSWRYNWRPALIVDTLSMTRTLIGNRSKRHDLGSIAAYLGLQGKGTMIENVKDMTRADIQANGLWDVFKVYCANDTDLCRGIFRKLAKDLPPEEFLVHDLVLRMAVDPMLLGDVTALSAYHDEVVTRKQFTLARAMTLGIIDGEADLMSNQKLAKALEALGVTPPQKVSQKTGALTWAFAKTDEEFQELREHDNPLVRDLVEARLGYKSTIEETRAARLTNIAQLDFPHHGQGVMPIALKIAGARTHRLSGDWKCNFQNMGRGSPIRDAMVAPPGHMLVAADAAQIEARILAWYCGQEYLVKSFSDGDDVYAQFASRLFGYHVTKETHPTQRFIGKTAVLGCGYGCGPLKFQMMVRSLSALAGEPLDFTMDEAEHVVKAYRAINEEVEWKWDWLNREALPQLAFRTQEIIRDGPVSFTQFTVTGPSNLQMFYPVLHRTAGQWVYDDAGKWNKLYGGKLIENIVQHMARVIIMNVALRMIPATEALSARLVLQCHDELVYCVPESSVELLKGLLHKEMTTSPSWADGLPLATEVKVGANYGACK